jgi:hypothetical protein
MPVPKIVEKIQKHRVLISTNLRDDFQLSSGTLIEIGGLSFVFTCYHSLSKLHERKLFINLGIPYQDCSFMAKKIWTNARLDIAYIEMDKAAVDKYRRGIEPVILGRLAPTGTVAPRYRAVAIVGYPFESLKMNDNKRVYDAEAVHVLSQTIKPESWPTSIEKDPHENILIEYGSSHGKDFVDQNGKKVTAMIHPGGLSGSAIWKFDPDTMESENPTYALMGIQTGWYKKMELLCGSYIEPLFKQVIEDYHIRI